MLINLSINLCIFDILDNNSNTELKWFKFDVDIERLEWSMTFCINILFEVWLVTTVDSSAAFVHIFNSFNKGKYFCN